MALVLNDRVKETTTTTGTGTVNLAGAETGFETFVERIGDGNATYYCIALQGGAEFEVGVGTVTSTTSQFGTASAAEVVMCHLSAPGWGTISSTSGSPVGFLPCRTMSTVRCETSTPQTLKPAS